MNLLQIDQLCEWTQKRTFSPGQTIFLEGEAPRMIYQVVRGVVKLTRCSTAGREIIVGLACPGQFIDVVAILDGEPHGVTAAALLGAEAEVVAIPRDMAMRHLELVRSLEQIALDELRDQRDWTVAMALERVEHRALRAITMLAQLLGEKVGPGFRCPLVLNRQEFAELIGATTETAIRVLSQFRKQGLIREGNGWITLSDAGLCPA